MCVVQGFFQFQIDDFIFYFCKSDCCFGIFAHCNCLDQRSTNYPKAEIFVNMTANNILSSKYIEIVLRLRIAMRET